jgi:cysteine desulfurase
LIGARTNEILFTSGATEANNLSILGFARWNKNPKRRKIITSAIEHKAVLNTCKALEKEGFEVVILPPLADGQILVKDLMRVLDQETLLVSIQAANNEIGTIQPIKELAEAAHSVGAMFHCDAAQAVGKIPFDVNALELDFVSFSSHKIYGPKGIGALFIQGGTNRHTIMPLYYGGGQENDLRPGTSYVPGIVGFGEACLLCEESMADEFKRITRMRDSFEAQLGSCLQVITINAIEANRLPNTSNIIFPGVEADALIINAPKIMVGTGSACNSGAIEPSHVLTAMGVSRENAHSAIRVSFGRFNGENDDKIAADELNKSYQRLISIR